MISLIPMSDSLTITFCHACAFEHSRPAFSKTFWDNAQIKAPKVTPIPREIKNMTGERLRSNKLIKTTLIASIQSEGSNVKYDETSNGRLITLKTKSPLLLLIKNFKSE